MTAQTPTQDFDNNILRAAELCKKIYDDVGYTGPNKIRKDWKNNQERVDLIVRTYMSIASHISESEFNELAGLPTGCLSKHLREKGIEPLHNTPEKKSNRIKEALNSKRNDRGQKALVSKSNQDIATQKEIVFLEKTEKPVEKNEETEIIQNISEPVEETPPEAPREAMQVQEQKEEKMTQEESENQNPVSSIKILPNGDISIEKVVITKKILTRGSKEYEEFMKRLEIPKEFKFT